jgi:hypothetical protein
MRKAGISFVVIAKETGVSTTQAVRDYKRALDEAACGRLVTLQSERSLELQRLEIALLALSQKVREGDLPAIDRWLRLCESRRRLLGLNMKMSRSKDAQKARRLIPKTYINLDLEKI